MGLVIRKQFFHQMLFVACVAIPYINVYEATFAIWVLTVLITLKNKYSFTLLKLIACFAAILSIAFVVSFFQEDIMAYEFVRDITYLLKPILGLFIGYQLCKDYTKNPLLIFINTGIIIAIIHLFLVVHSFLFLHTRTMHDLRLNAGYFSDFEVYAVLFIIFHKQLGIIISRKKVLFGLVILAISTFFYLARTNFIQFVILFMALKGYFVLNKRSITIVSSIVLFVLVGYAAIYYYNPSRNGKGMEVFLYKIKNSPIEPFKTRVIKDNFKDFNDNYRSYENIYTIRQIKAGGTAKVLFGEGLGSSVDLKKKVWLQTSMMRFIPFLHNGFMTVLLKSGLLGDLILLFSISLLFRYKDSNDDLIQNINYILLGTGIYLIVSYWVFMGLYFVADTKSIVIGYLICYREVLIRKKRLDEAQ
jgi:hypothetical protein